MNDVYTVSALNQYIKQLFTIDRTLNAVFVSGEVSNCKYHYASGHIYFTLKDRDSAIACVMFAGNQRTGLDFRLENGQKVVAFGSVSVYERDGKYQLYAKKIVLDGVGLLYEKYEALKKKLSYLGYFDESHKKPIPKYPKTVGIVTANTGAAIQDIINISRRRNPYIQLILYPALVQGQDAAPSIVRGIKALEAYPVDTIIVGRGGGSLEDLWAFNEEIVAKAIYDCSIPVISAVGHETDVALSDFVADLRAPTPSAAAELAVPDIREFFEKISVLEGRMDRAIAAKVDELYKITDHLRLRLEHISPQSRLEQQRMYLISLEESLEQRMADILKQKKHDAALLGQKLEGLSPLARLLGGYSVVIDEKGSLIRSVEQIALGDVLRISVSDGDILAKTLETEKIRRFKDGED